MENKSFEELESLLNNKTFEELTENERSWVETIVGDEHAYQGLYELVNALANTKILEPNLKIKKDVVKSFRSKNQTHWMTFISYRPPVYVSVLSVLIIGAILWLLRPSKNIIIEKKVAAEQVLQVDTLYVQMAPDTVYIEKRIMVEVPVFLPSPPEKSQAIVVKGNTLSEQKDLQSLLVSGEPFR